MKSISHWINGAVVSEKSDKTGEVFNPATGQICANVEFATSATVDKAVNVATEAFSSWRHSSLTKRTQVLFAFRELVNQNKEKIAALITQEHGKVLSDALGEVTRGLEVVEFACGIPHLLKGGFSEEVSTGVDVYSIRQPLGPVAIISPFNFPAMVPMWFFPIALACGNTVIVKPSEKDPSAIMFIAQLLKEAGLPDGVFNVVHGDKVAVDALLNHPGIKSISFVGSTPIAKYVYETGTKSGKRVQALGGAKNNMIVLPDADLELAADAAINAGFGSAGERCMAISAIVAVEPIADQLIEKIKSAEQALDLSTLLTEEMQAKVGSIIKEKEDKKAYTFKASTYKNNSYFPYQKQTNTFPAFPHDSFPSNYPSPYPGLTYPRTTFNPTLPIQFNPTLSSTMPALTYTNPNQTASAYNNPNQTALDKKKLQIAREKEVTNCNDCGDLGHWGGDQTCPKQIAKLAGYAMYRYTQ